jgi:hypothetical protein
MMIFSSANNVENTTTCVKYEDGQFKTTTTLCPPGVPKTTLPAGSVGAPQNNGNMALHPDNVHQSTIADWSAQNNNQPHKDLPESGLPSMIEDVSTVLTEAQKQLNPPVHDDTQVLSAMVQDISKVLTVIQQSEKQKLRKNLSKASYIFGVPVENLLEVNDTQVLSAMVQDISQLLTDIQSQTSQQKTSSRLLLPFSTTQPNRKSQPSSKTNSRFTHFFSKMNDELNLHSLHSI